MLGIKWHHQSIFDRTCLAAVQCRSSILHGATQYGRMDVVKVIFAAGAVVTEKNEVSVRRGTGGGSTGKHIHTLNLHLIMLSSLKQKICLHILFHTFIVT